MRKEGLELAHKGNIAHKRVSAFPGAKRDVAGSVGG